MRSRAARLTVGAIAWIAIAAAAFFLVQSEQQIGARRAAVRAFDLRARETTDAIGEMRAAERAYTALGQGAAFWIPKVAATFEAARGGVAALQQAAVSGNASASLEAAQAALEEFGTVDARARQYLQSRQYLMAGDVVFTEGGPVSARAAGQVEAARIAEHQAADAAVGGHRRQQAMALGGAAGVAALVILVLLPRTRIAESHERPTAASRTGEAGLVPHSEPPEAAAPPSAAARAELDRSATGPAGRAAAPVLKAAADLCTDFGRVVDVEGLSTLLGRAAEMMEATGLIVWMGSSTGADLRAVLAHGYTAEVLAHMPALPRSGANAAAAAYRTGVMQIVPSRPGVSTGAVVAPIVGPDGCVGALSAETRHDGEGSDSVQALATIFAAQLGGVLSASAPQTSADDEPAPRAASG
jgi:hypothetical protein